MRSFLGVFTGLVALTACGIDVPLTGGIGSGGTTTGSQTDLPCDVASVLANNCLSCHGEPPSGGAPMALVTYDDLIATNSSGITYAQRSLTRMTATTSPMPPAGPAVSAADIATFQAWVNAGTPMGTCGTTTSDPLNAAPVCTSGKFYSSRGDDGSSQMDPGEACIACHDQSGGEAPHFSVAGTVYPTGHEPNLCDGVAGNATVVITDANSAVYNLTVNSAGNFYSRATMAFPIRAKVVVGGQERDMASTQTSGDCNSCHTQNGASLAPGRIVTP